MKAIVNVGSRCVELIHLVEHDDLIMPLNVDYEYELQQDSKDSKVKCTYKISFKDFDEWRSIHLLDGRTVDFHYDYMERSDFKNKKEWGLYVFQGYEYINNEPQVYDKQVVNKVNIVF